jgi:hypothetical protein
MTSPSPGSVPADPSALVPPPVIAAPDDSAEEPSAGPFRCTTASAGRAEPMFATASRVDRWLLVEQTGPWGPESVPAARMAPEAFATVSRLAREFRARLLLIRRPSSSEAEQSGVTVFLAESRAGRELLMSRRFDDVAELPSLQPPARDPGWREETEPLYLVCTHGRHDPCCALFGRPVASAMCGLVPERTWESSHVGGDRFGANVVVLPQGLYLGRVIPGRAPEVVDAISERRIPVDLLRGRSSFTLTAQAAQHFARAELAGGSAAALDGFEDLQPLGEEQLARNEWQVRLQGPDGPLVVVVRRTPGNEPQRLTCHAPEPRVFPGFAFVSIDTSPAAHVA